MTKKYNSVFPGIICRATSWVLIKLELLLLFSFTIWHLCSRLGISWATFIGVDIEILTSKNSLSSKIHCGKTGQRFVELSFDATDGFM